MVFFKQLAKILNNFTQIFEVFRKFYITAEQLLSGISESSYKNSLNLSKKFFSRRGKGSKRHQTPLPVFRL